MANDVTFALETALYAKLSGDSGAGGVNTLATGGIYEGNAPFGTTGPYVVYLMQFADDTDVFSQRAYTEFLYLVKAVQQTRDQSTVSAIADRIDVLLNRGTLAGLSGYTLKALLRERPFLMRETMDGVDYLHRGAVFRIVLEKN